MGYGKLDALGNTRVREIVSYYVNLCEPSEVIITDDGAEDAELLRARALEGGEEHPLGMSGHTYHFDGVEDQARDKAHTKLLLSEPVDFGFDTGVLDRSGGLAEITGLMRGIMRGKTMYVCFRCLGPVGSEFSLLAMQISDRQTDFSLRPDRQPDHTVR